MPPPTSPPDSLVLFLLLRERGTRFEAQLAAANVPTSSSLLIPRNQTPAKLCCTRDARGVGLTTTTLDQRRRTTRPNME